MDIRNMSTYEISRYLKDERHTAFILWQVADVLNVADEIGKNISRQQAEDILKNIDEYADCNEGITWGTIENAVRNCPEPLTTLEKLASLKHYMVGKTEDQLPGRKYLATCYYQSLHDYDINFKLRKVSPVYAETLEEVINKAYENEQAIDNK